jgi:hypothetical protein
MESPPPKERADSTEPATDKTISRPNYLSRTGAESKLNGSHPGFSNLKSQPGVYRCKLWADTNKRDRNHADYKGVLHLTGSKASVLVWVHVDGSLGLRLEKIVDRRKEAR